MNDKKRNRVLSIILAGLCAAVIITAVLYAATIRTYRVTGTSANIAHAEETKTADSVVAKTEKLAAKPQSANVIPKKQDAVPENTDNGMLSQNNTAEYENAIYRHKSDTLYIAVSQCSINDEPYLLAHVIIKNPDQIRTCITKNKTSISQNFTANDCIFSVPGSTTNSTHSDFINGLHVCDSKNVGMTDTAYGNETYFTEDGTIGCMENGTEYNPETQENIKWTVLSDGPVLISGNEKLQIPEKITWEPCKSAIGMVRPCEYYFLTASDGDYVSGISYADIQSIMAEKSCSYACILVKDADVSMSAEGNTLNAPAEQCPRRQYEYINIYE